MKANKAPRGRMSEDGELLHQYSTCLDRETHLLENRHGKRLPSHVAVLECDYSEPRPGEYTVKRAAVWLGRYTGAKRTKQGTWQGPALDCLGYLERLCRKQSCLYVFGVNLYKSLVGLRLFDNIGPGRAWSLRESRADYVGGGPAPKKSWSGFAVLEKGTFILVVKRRGGGVCHFVDVANYAAGIVSDTGLSLFERTHKVVDWVTAYLDWVRETEQGSFQHTLGGQAFYAYRHRFMAEPILVHSCQEAINLERAALAGGRCECFYLGEVKEPLYHLDINSSYGFLASRASLPAAPRNILRPPIDPLCCNLDNVIADVDVLTSEPCFPVKDEARRLLIFPVGRFRTTLCGPEIMLNRKAIVKIHSAVEYTFKPLFKDWAPWAWSERERLTRHGPANLLPMVKAYNQILYGKFGQGKRGWRHEPKEPSKDLWALWFAKNRGTGETEQWRCIAGRVERYVRGGETRDSCPAITAWINSLGRARLWRLIVTAGRGNVRYVDTDSLWVGESGMERLKKAGFTLGDSLGGLRLVASHTATRFAGWKHWVTGTTGKRAGRRPPSGVASFAPRSLCGPEAIVASCRLMRPPRSVETKVESDGPTAYRHGLVNDDGWVRPFTMGGKDNATAYGPSDESLLPDLWPDLLPARAWEA